MPWLARMLTDPVWGERASPATFAGPKRFQPVPIALSELPELDAVLISHDHYDHLDYPTILELKKRNAPFFTSLGVGAPLFPVRFCLATLRSEIRQRAATRKRLLSLSEARASA